MKLIRFWKNRGYWQKGTIIGIIFGLLAYIGCLTYFMIAFSVLIPVSMLNYVLFIGIIILIGCGLLFGVFGFLIGLVKKGFWKELILVLLIIIVVVVATRPYGLCYSDFLENCEGKKVEVTGKIIKGGPCLGFGETYILCNTNIPSCSHMYKEASLIKSILSFFRGTFGRTSQVTCDYGENDDCLRLVKVCTGEGENKKINDYVENLLPNPANKTVKVKGKIFIYKPLRFAMFESGNIGIIPESITIIKDEISVTPKDMMVIEDEE